MSHERSDPLVDVLKGLAQPPPTGAARLAPRRPPRNPGFITVEVVAYDPLSADLIVTSDRWSGTCRIDPFVTGAFSADIANSDRARHLVGKRFVIERYPRYAAGAYLPKLFRASSR